MIKSNTKENLKTAAIAVLFLTTILLLYLLWADTDRLRLTSIFDGEQSADVSAGNYIEPEYVVLGRGDGSFVFLDDRRDAFNTGIEVLSAYNHASGAFVTEISETTFSEAMSSYQSVYFSMGYSIPFSEFCEFFGIGKISGAENVGSIEAFAFSRASDESVFIKDAEKGSCYRLLFSQAQDNPLYSQDTSGAELCYFAGDVLGGESRALVALSASSGLAAAPYRSSSEAGDDVRSRVARAVFGETFDFVRRITDSFGNVTYMYGYGAKTLTAKNDGSFEYTAEISDGESAGFFGDLTTALSFAESCEMLEGSFALRRAEKSGSGKSASYTFELVQQLGGEDIAGENAYALKLEISAGQLSHAELATIDAAEVSAEETQAAEPVNVLASNCNHIYNISTNTLMGVNGTEAFSYVADNTKTVLRGYFKSVATNTLIPCWMVSTDSARFYFDLYTAEPLGFERLSEQK